MLIVRICAGTSRKFSSLRTAFGAYFSVAFLRKILKTRNFKLWVGRRLQLYHNRSWQDGILTACSRLCWLVNTVVGSLVTGPTIVNYDYL